MGDAGISRCYKGCNAPLMPAESLVVATRGNFHRNRLSSAQVLARLDPR